MINNSKNYTTLHKDFKDNLLKLTFKMNLVYDNVAK
jgi:hypothetical protein